MIDRLALLVFRVYTELSLFSLRGEKSKKRRIRRELNATSVREFREKRGGNVFFLCVECLFSLERVGDFRLLVV